ITAAGNFTADATTQLLGGSGATPTTAGVSVTAGSAGAGGNLTAGPISGKDVQLTAYGKSGGGSLTVGGAVNAGHSVTIKGDPGGAGLGPVTLKVASPITSGGGIDIETNGGPLQLNAGLTANGALTASGQDVTVAPAIILRSDAQGAG